MEYLLFGRVNIKLRLTVIMFNIAPNLPDRNFTATQPNQKWVVHMFHQYAEEWEKRTMNVLVT